MTTSEHIKMSENNWAGRPVEPLPSIELREAIRLTDTAAAMLMHRLRESVPWREAAREYERVYPGRSSDDMIDVLRWITTRAALTDTLRAENARLTAQLAEARAEIDSAWFGIDHGWAIESRAEMESEAKTNGFKFGLAQAVHTVWKREPKVQAARAQAIAEVKAQINDWIGAERQDDSVSWDESYTRIHAKLDALAPAPPGAYDLVAHLERQRAFSARTFGPGSRTAG